MPPTNNKGRDHNNNIVVQRSPLGMQMMNMIEEHISNFGIDFDSDDDDDFGYPNLFRVQTLPGVERAEGAEGPEGIDFNDILAMFQSAFR